MTAETATVMFTDLVGSTELRMALGEEAADALDLVHLALLREAVEAVGGRVVKSLGDGIMATFGAAADAVGAAVAAQQAAEEHTRRHPDRPLRIRIGVSVGDVSGRDGDLHGAAVVEAARLCDAAQGGQVLVADVVRGLARGRGGHRFESVGVLDLKGLEDPVPACSVAWEPLGAADGGMLPFPHLLTPSTGVAYTGRLGLRADVDKAWDRVVAGEGSRLVMLVGEPGIGKTRTAAEVAGRVHAQGALVLYGRCDEALALSYQPFVEALDWQTAHDAALPLGRFAGDLVRLLPDLGARVDGLPRPMASDSRAEEHRLFEATAAWLVDASRPSGLVLVVDDLHWATRPTLDLLMHVARAVMADPTARVLLLATYRDTDVDRAHPLSRTLADLRRLPNVDRLPVDPLSEDEVMDLVAAAAGHELDDAVRALALRAHAETEGNPFFVGEVLRHFVEVGAVHLDGGRWRVGAVDDVDVPEGVRDVVGRRLDRLSPRTDEVLTAGAVIGRDFSLEVVAHVSGVDVDVVVDLLDEALRARLVEEVAGDRFRFSHALTRQTLLEELSATRRRRLHRRVVEALEALRPDDWAALAHHSVEAGPVGGDLTGAVRYSLAAGEQALADHAAGDAIVHVERVLELLEDVEDTPSAWWLQARCCLGEAQRDVGDPTHHETLLAVTRDALAADELDLAVRSAIANARVIMSVVSGVDHDRIRQLESVLDALGDDPRPERALLLAQLAAELAGTPATSERRVGLAVAALELLRAEWGPDMETRVLVAAAMALNSPERLEEVEGLSARYLVAADGSGDPNLRSVARAQRAWILLNLGDLAGARAHIEEAVALSAEEGSPTTRWMAAGFAAQLPAWDGDLVAARNANLAALELGQASGEPDALTWFAAIEGPALYAEGRLGEAVEAARHLAVEHPESLLLAAYHAQTLCEAGRVEEARSIAHRHRLLDPSVVWGEMFFTLSWVFQAEICRHLEDAAAARRLADALDAHRELWACSGVWVFGPTHLPLATLHHVAGDRDRACREALAAWDAVDGAGIEVIVPMVAVRVGELVVDTDPVAARRVVDRGLEGARSMAMGVREDQLEQLRARLA